MSAVNIDGSMGEGGGQVLRTSLSLSALTGRPVSFTNIRAQRRRPGLMRQHLTALRAAAAVCGAKVTGDEINSTQATFAPGPISAGEYHFAVASAGSACLVLHTVLPALLSAPGPSRVTVEGGTHNPLAPPFDFIDRCFLPVLRQMGADVSLTLERPGFFPAGGGRIVADIKPSALQPIELLDRGEIRTTTAQAMVANLSPKIGKRELAVIRRRLVIARDDARVLQLTDEADGPGNVCFVEVGCDHIHAVFSAFGTRAVTAEKVGQSVARQAERWLQAGVPVGVYLADQLLIPMWMAGGGTFRTRAVSQHTRSNAEVLRLWTGCRVTFTEESADRARVTVAAV